MRKRGLGLLTQPPAPDELSVAEYEALRATISARGHLRLLLFLAGLIAWASTLLIVVALLPNPLLAAVPLTLLVGTFEALRSAHFGAERIGRYLLVFFEEPDQRSAPEPGPGGRAPVWHPPAWEHAVARVGGSVPGAAGHPLFMPVFAAAAIINSIAVVLPGPTPAEWTALGVLHLAFIGWMIHVDRGVRAQRAHDEARFRAIRDDVRHEGTKDTKLR